VSRTATSLEERLAYLGNARHYPHHPGRVQRIETHFAWIFLAGRFVFKLKKPSRQAGMDYRSLASRRAGCLKEVRLNRRLARDVYLGVMPLRRTDRGTLSLGAGPGTVDWLVKMRRLPAARMLDRLIADRALRPRDLDRVVAHLIAFFRRARARPLGRRAYLARLRRRARETTRELGAPDFALDRRRLERLARAQLDFIATQPAELGCRGAQVIDGHGDLRPEHIFVAVHGCRIIDCLEFDADLRRLVPADEMAFLMLECERIGGRAAAKALLMRYRHGRPDPVSDGLIHFYMSQQALTRAKIAAWHLRDPEFRGKYRLWRARAAGYLAAASRHIRLAQRAAAAAKSRSC